MIYDRDTIINMPVVIKKELKFLFNLSDNLTVFDIGACEGESSIQYSRLIPNSTIYCFEPLPENIELIKKNFLKYKIQNAQYFNFALAEKNGFAEFHVSEGKPENIEATDWDFGNKSSSLLQPDKHLEMVDFIKFGKTIKVQTITLKSFCNDHKIDRIDLIHLDVQGAELLVLKGAADFIKNIKVIWLEVSTIEFYKGQPLAEDIKKFMFANGFILVKGFTNSDQGDELYVSQKHFSKFKILSLKYLIAGKHFLNKVFQKLKSIVKK